MADRKKIRAFLAIDLPQEIKEQIGDIQGKLKEAVDGVRWTRPEGIHLTIKFFGDIDHDEVGRISEVVEKRTKDVGSLSFFLGEMGAFPSVKKPRVLWVGVDGDTAKLLSLQDAIEKDLEESGFTRENRSFKPHLTLGRVWSSRGMITGLREAMERKKNEKREPFYAKGLGLFKSELKPGGAVYTRLAYFSFGG